MKKFVPLFFTLLPAILFSCSLGNSGSSNSVVLDGKITSSDEWAATDAFATSLDLVECWPDGQRIKNFAVMTVWSKNDDTWLYMLYKIAWPPSEIDSNDIAFIEIFIGPCCPWAQIDQGCLLFGGQTWDGYAYNSEEMYADTDAGGQNDVEGAATYDGAFYWFEFRKRLNSGDGYDWTLLPAQTVSLMGGVWDDSIVMAYEGTFLVQLSE